MAFLYDFGINTGLDIFQLISGQKVCHYLGVDKGGGESKQTVTKSEIVIFTVPYLWNDPLSFQVSSDKLRARVVSLDLRGLKVYNIFNGTTMVGAVGKILRIMLSRLFQIAILKLK